MCKAVVLLSGGLDSMLAAKMIIDQGIYVEGINFFTGFCGDGISCIKRRKNRDCSEKINASWVAEQLGIKLNIINVFEEYKNVLLKPKYGYGSHINPCLDCKIFMVNQTKKWLEKNGFDFIVTGEVIGQRPKSQLKHHLPIVLRDSGIDDILLRPLCAKFLPMTKPEREGWVDREKLEKISGRGRSKQIALAKKFGFEKFAQPSGGCCFLITEHYADRLKDLWQMRATQEYSLDDINLLKVGRHLRPNPNFKMIIGREEAENIFLKKYKNKYLYMFSTSHLGPFVLIEGDCSVVDKELAAQIIASYCKEHNGQKVQISICEKNGEEKILEVLPLGDKNKLIEWYI